MIPLCICACDFISHDDSYELGTELSEQTRSILTRANIKYVDIWLHPVRFLMTYYLVFPRMIEMF